jgi:hypothetical protein
MPVVTKEKKQKALLKLKTATEGKLEVSEYRKLRGLLWYIVGAMLLPLRMMNMLSKPLRKGQEWDSGPNTWVKPHPFLLEQWEAWVSWLSKASGTHVANVWNRQFVMEPTHEITFHWVSDGCTHDDKTEHAAVGGFEHGRWWFYEFTHTQAQVFHITLIEAMGAVGNTLNFGPGVPEKVNIGVEVDATSAMKMNADGYTKSMALAKLHSLYVATNEYQRLKHCITTDHISGDGNDMADAISRKKWSQFHQMCEQLGVKPRQVALHPKFIEIIHQMETFLLQLNSPTTA